ncbi:MAG: pseudouridine synthase [Kiritimatiellia bacterium]|jgi:23S rRNA pseudouridine2605 synthase|nr:pseudouridine synthase [Kiritimatiellia bacterium]MDP6848332.1 pseudouridine synthase [Kiritimatiellia bacterium]
MEEQTIRLQKFLSERGFGSRRGVVTSIEAGRVRVNGETVSERGARIVPGADAVEVDGVVVATEKPRSRTIIMYKPRGYICSRSSAQGKTIYDLLPPELFQLRPVGRLDKDSEGLLLLSNDGELIECLTHPRFQQSKIYRVTVSGKVSPQVLARLRSRMVIDGYRIHPVGIVDVTAQADADRRVLEFTLKEGRNRQIRKMCAVVKLRVHRLVRVGIRGIPSTGQTTGKWRELTAAEESQLKGRADA